MKVKEYILMSLRDLWRRKGRTILTSLGITIGTLLIVTMMGIVVGLKGFMNDVVNDGDSGRSIKVIHYKNFSDVEYDDEIMSNDEKFENEYFKKIDDDLIKNIQDTGKVEAVVAEISYNVHSIIFNDKQYTGEINANGYNLNANVYSKSAIDKVRHDQKDDSLNPLKFGKFIDEEQGQVLIGEKLLNKFELTKDDVLDKEIEILVSGNANANGKKITKKLKVVGIIDEHFDGGNCLTMTGKDVAQLKGYETLQKDYFENKGYDSLDVLVNNISDVQSVSDTIKELDYYSFSTVEQAKSIESTLGAMNKGFLILGIIVLFVASIGIVNTMGMAVAERTKSIGVMKAVGASSGAVRLMFLIQSSLIGLIGGVFGILLGSGINSLIQMYAESKISQSKMSMSISIGLPWHLILLILVFSMVIALISGIYPANKAAKLDPVEALRR